MGVEAPALERCRVDQAERARETQKIKVDEASGDLTFWAIAVDKQKKPNRKGFLFDWQKPADVEVRALQANPVLLYMHDDGGGGMLSGPSGSAQAPSIVGRIEDIEVGSRRVRMKMRIPGYDELEPLRRWIQDGYLRAVSIGFYIVQAVDAETGDPLGDGPGPIRVQKFEIVELSLVTIGAHETALIQQGTELPAIDVAGAKWADMPGDKGTLYRLMVDADGHTDDAPATQSDDDGDTQAEDSRWRAVPYSRHGDKPKAEEGAAWDAGAQVRKATPKQLGMMATLEDAANPEAKASYKLPHHRADGTVVWRGVAAAMGALLGARGGVKGASPAAKKSAHSHLKRHYGQFDREAPDFRQDYATDELGTLYELGIIEIPGYASGPEVICVVAEPDFHGVTMTPAPGMLPDDVDSFDVEPESEAPRYPLLLADALNRICDLEEQVAELRRQHETKLEGFNTIQKMDAVDAEPHPEPAPAAQAPAVDMGRLRDVVGSAIERALESDPRVRALLAEQAERVIDKYRVRR